MNRLDELNAWARERDLTGIINAVLVLVDAPAAQSVLESPLTIRAITPPSDIDEAFTAGTDLTDELIDSGVDCITVCGVDIPAARTVIGVVTKRDAAELMGLPTELDDQTWMTQCGEVRDHMHAVRDHAGEPMDFLRAVSSPPIAMLTAVIARASERNTCVLIDGMTASAAALVVQRMDIKASAWWVMTQREDHTAHAIACERLDSGPLLTLGLRDEPGVGALLALPIVQAALLR
jgi:nicotinate-nucleotide--dimethylbenzimidazole phosphoribosyltransferase